MSELDEEDRDEMDHSGAEGDGYGIAAAKIVAVQAPESARTAGRKPRASAPRTLVSRGDDRWLRQGGIVVRPLSYSPSPLAETPGRLTFRLQIFHTYPATPSEGNHIELPSYHP